MFWDYFLIFNLCPQILNIRNSRVLLFSSRKSKEISRSYYTSSQFLHPFANLRFQNFLHLQLFYNSLLLQLFILLRLDQSLEGLHRCAAFLFPFWTKLNLLCFSICVFELFFFFRFLRAFSYFSSQVVNFFISADGTFYYLPIFIILLNYCSVICCRLTVQTARCYC